MVLMLKPREEAQFHLTKSEVKISNPHFVLHVLFELQVIFGVYLIRLNFNHQSTSLRIRKINLHLRLSLYHLYILIAISTLLKISPHHLQSCKCTKKRTFTKLQWSGNILSQSGTRISDADATRSRSSAPSPVQVEHLDEFESFESRLVQRQEFQV